MKLFTTCLWIIFSNWVMKADISTTDITNTEQKYLNEEIALQVTGKCVFFNKKKAAVPLGRVALISNPLKTLQYKLQCMNNYKNTGHILFRTLNISK